MRVCPMLTSRFLSAGGSTRFEMLRALAVWFLIMIAESVHGTIRRLLVEPALGDLRARQVSVFTGMLLIFAITLLCIRWMRLGSVTQLLLVGVLWGVLTLVFEIVVGMFVLGYGADRIAEDFDPRRGGFMGIGLTLMLLAPLLAAHVRKLGPFRQAV